MTALLAYLRGQVYLVTKAGLQRGSSLESLWQALGVTAFDVSFAMCLPRNWVSAHLLSISSDRVQR